LSPPRDGQPGAQKDWYVSQMARDKKPKADKAKRPSKAAKAKRAPKAPKAKRAPRKAPSSRFFRSRLKTTKAKKDQEQGLDESQAHPGEAEGSSAEARPDAQETDERQDQAPQPEPVAAAAQGAEDSAEAHAEAATEETGEAGESSKPDDQAVQQGRQESDEAIPESPEQPEEPEVQAPAEPADDADQQHPEAPSEEPDQPAEAAEQGTEETAEQAEELAQEVEQPEAEALGDPADAQEEPQAAAEEEDQEQSPVAAEQPAEEAAEQDAAAEAEQPDEEEDLRGPSLQEILDQQRGHLERKRARTTETEREKHAAQLEPDEDSPQAQEDQPSEPAAEDEQPEPEPAAEDEQPEPEPAAEDEQPEPEPVAEDEQPEPEPAAEEEQPESEPAEEVEAQEQPAESTAQEADQPSPAQLIAAALAGRPAEPASVQPGLGEAGRGAAGRVAQPAPTKRRIGLVGIVLFFNSLLVMLVVAGLIDLYLRRGEGLSSVQRAQAVQAKPSAPSSADVSPPDIGPDEAVSWPMAEKEFQSQRYAQALMRYRKLLEASQKVPSEDMVSDFCRLRAADCLRQLGKGAEAKDLLEKVTHSRSPIARGLAWYRLAVGDVDGGQFLQARMKACQALAVLGALADARAVEADCDYLICRALTVEALASHNLDVAVDWGAFEYTDPFAGLDEPALRELLRQGARQLAQAVLGPRVQAVESNAPALRLAASCSHSPLEELLQRIATEAGEDVRWMSVDSKARRRMVAVCFRSVSAHRLSEVACGAAGLVARFTGEQVHVHDPQSAVSLADQRELILREADSAWRRFFLRAPNDRRLARGRFAVANLSEAAGNLLGAIQEYQLVAHRFGADPVAPEAMLRSARARTAIRDYAGARKDLLVLLDRHPGFQASDEAYLCLGQARMNSGLHDKATKVFSKLYHLNLTPVSRREASFGAGKCLYRNGEYKEASKWLARYITLVKSPSPQLAEGYFLLARSESRQGNFDGAAQALRAALAAKPPVKRRADVLMELARTEAGRQRFVPAVAALSRVERKHLDEKQLPELLLLSSQIYRSMDLAEKALVMLRTGVKEVSDPEARAELEVELARCHADSGELKEARQLLTKTLPAIKPGRKAHIAACELARICLASGQATQAITVTRELLKSACQDDIRRQAHLILGAAYLALKDYERAALAFSGTAVKDPGAKDK